jgi:hypothetical protein
MAACLVPQPAINMFNFFSENFFSGHILCQNLDGSAK